MIEDRTQYDDLGNARCACGAAGESAPCPFAQEVGGATDEAAMCTCCSDCRGQCADDI